MGRVKDAGEKAWTYVERAVTSTKWFFGVLVLVAAGTWHVHAITAAQDRIAVEVRGLSSTTGDVNKRLESEVKRLDAADTNAGQRMTTLEGKHDALSAMVSADAERRDKAIERMDDAVRKLEGLVNRLDERTKDPPRPR